MNGLTDYPTDLLTNRPINQQTSRTTGLLNWLLFYLFVAHSFFLVFSPVIHSQESANISQDSISTSLHPGKIEQRNCFYLNTKSLEWSLF